MMKRARGHCRKQEEVVYVCGEESHSLKTAWYRNRKWENQKKDMASRKRGARCERRFSSNGNRKEMKREGIIEHIN